MVDFITSPRNSKKISETLKDVKKDDLLYFTCKLDNFSTHGVICFYLHEKRSLEGMFVTYLNKNEFYKFMVQTVTMDVPISNETRCISFYLLTNEFINDQIKLIFNSSAHASNILNDVFVAYKEEYNLLVELHALFISLSHEKSQNKNLLFGKIPTPIFELVETFVTKIVLYGEPKLRYQVLEIMEKKKVF